MNIDFKLILPICCTQLYCNPLYIMYFIVNQNIRTKLNGFSDTYFIIGIFIVTFYWL